MIPPLLLTQYTQKLAAEAGTPVTEDEATLHIVELIDKVCRMIGHSLKFGYHDEFDIRQQCYVEVIAALRGGKYDIRKKPLANYLYVHVRNRILNLKRKQLFRSEAPCKCCDAFNPGPTPCRRWIEWNRRNESKQRIMRPMSLSGDSALPAPPSDPSEAVILDELRSYIEGRLPADLVADFRAFADEGELSKERRNRIRTVLRAILEDSPYAS